jgi:hypothetical protein
MPDMASPDRLVFVDGNSLDYSDENQVTVRSPWWSHMFFSSETNRGCLNLTWTPTTILFFSQSSPKWMESFSDSWQRRLKKGINFIKMWDAWFLRRRMDHLILGKPAQYILNFIISLIHEIIINLSEAVFKYVFYQTFAQ